MKSNEVKIPSTNGDGKKSKKNTNGLPKTGAVAPDASFNSGELLRVLTEVKNGNFTVRMPIDEVGLSGKINDTLNQMITNLHETTIKNQDQDWLKSNLAKFAVMLQGQKDLTAVTKRILSELAHVVSAHYGAFYILKTDESTQAVTLKRYSAYAYQDDMSVPKEFSIGEGLVGQCALEKKRILITNIPKGYVKINSALGKAKPANLVILPVLFENKVRAVIELASLYLFNEQQLAFLGQLTESIGIVLNTIEAFTRTEELLKQAQSQAGELQDKALLLVKKNEEVGAKNKELAFQNDEKEKRAAELSVANKELAFQNDEKEKRAAELSVANKELAFQNDEKEKRAAELSVANKELAFQNEEKEKRAAELGIANKELNQSEELLQNSLKEVSDYKDALDETTIIALTDQKGIIRKVNSNFCKISKYKEEELIGQDHRIINSGYHPKEFIRDLWETIAKGKIWKGELKNKAKDGTFYWVETTIVPFLNEKGKPYQYLAIRVDTTKRKESEEQLKTVNKDLAFQNEEKEKRAAELVIANKELAFQNDEKERRAMELSVAYKVVEESRTSLEKKAEQLAITSKYKSEFLANMSHELRSPLNSLLILAQQLHENSDGNLTDKQVRYAKTIQSCGEDLIQLINDILDLSKIESGIISANISTVRIAEIIDFIDTTYKPIAESRNLKFTIETDNDLPASMTTDMQRVNQILKNLLSNAFKFTEKGEVTLKISEAHGNWKPGQPKLDYARRVISFSVNDTGIGIPHEKQLIIFEAFQQAEGSTSRKYGGTGLGLSISRGLVELLGGTIELKSELGRGSSFTLFLPLETIPNVAPREVPLVARVTKPEFPKNEVPTNYLTGVSRTPVDEPGAEYTEIVSESVNEAGDDRSYIVANDMVILVAEHDLRFAKIMIEKAHENGLKAIVATSYEDVFNFIHKFSPIAITVDVNMPSTNGWKVMQMLRSDLQYHHIPIHVISGEESRVLALKSGARSFLLKPLENGLLNQLFSDMISYHQKETRSILIVEDNEIDASQIAKMLQDDKIIITIANTCMAALECIAKEDYDCIILDFMLPDVSGNDLIHEISRAKKIFTPVIVYSVKDFTSIELNNVNFNTNSNIMKGVNSIEYLLAETVSQLHINHKNLAPDKRKIIESIRNQKDILNGKTILIVDDDVRNLFAMTTIFERFNMQVAAAESGQESINILKENPKIEMILMDIMMPGMDGYETIKKIRLEDKNSMLPIIAVTAKAMKQDREKCITAGASDYITKPVKTDQLLSLMRLWFCKQ